MKRLGLIVNPIAGMGGKVGLKGTDGVLDEALRLGAEPIAGFKAVQMLSQFVKLYSSEQHELRWYTCSGKMGADIFRAVGLTNEDYEVIYNCSEPTSASDTRNASKLLLERDVELIVFCGGDGTARDIYEVVNRSTGILGIPSGVKMHSGVFGINPESVAHIVFKFLDEQLRLNDIEIMDLDEEKYRKGEWCIRLYGVANTPFEPSYIQGGKAIIEAVSDADVKDDIASYLLEQMAEAKDTLFILGPGSTVQCIGDRLGIDTTLLGIDAVLGNRLLASDLNEQGLLELLSKHPKVRLVLSPIGAQGFILGRGNLQLSAAVLRKVGLENISVLATPAKLARTPELRVDTGDAELDREFKAMGYITVTIGYHTMCMRHIK